MNKLESPCLSCEIHMIGRSKNTPRCINCPDRKDYLLKIDGYEPHHRGFNPAIKGYVKFDSVDTCTQPKTANTSLSKSSKKQKKATLKKIDKLEISPKFKSDSRTCYVCNTKWERKDVPLNFTKSVTSSDGYLKMCKKCASEKIKATWRQKKEEKIKATWVSLKAEKMKEKKKEKKRLKHITDYPSFTKTETVVGPEIKQTPTDNSNTVTINFEGFEGLLESLKNKAKEEIRTVENQALFYLKEKMETIVKWKKRN